MRAAAFMCFVFILCGCTHQKSDFRDSLGKEVTLVGIAQPRKEGAALKGDSFYVWLEGASSWPSGVELKKVRVTGLLVEEHDEIKVMEHAPTKTNAQEIPIKESSNREEASSRFIIVNPKWELVEDRG